MKDRPKDAHLQLSDMGILIKAERDSSPKEYPSFRSLHDPLHIYFTIIIHQLTVSGSMANLLEFSHGSSKYLSGLYNLYLKYEWPQVLEYHFKFHNRRIVEMQEGTYVGWGHIDRDLMSPHLFGHPKSRPTKPSSSQPWSCTKDVSNSFATHSRTGNAPHLANQAEYTNAASATHLSMGLEHAPRPTRILAG